MNNRVEKLISSLSDNEAIFISGFPNIFYYSGFASEDAYLLISKNARYIITDSRYIIQAKEQADNFEVLNIAEGFEKIFSKVSADYIGYEENRMTVREFQKLRMKLAGNQTFVGKQSFIDKQRRVKSIDEINKIAEAERIGDNAFEYVLNMIKPGISEREIALELEFYMKRNGASALSFDTIVASGKRSAMPHGLASEKKIEKGDFVTLDFGCVFEGYCSDMTRTVVVGKASEKQREIYNIVLNAQQAAINAIEAGALCCDIDRTAREVIAEAGYGDCFGHGLGHSVGIEIHENPSFSPRCGDELKNGHVITVEPGIYVEDFGGVRIEDLIAVKDGKPFNLTHSPKELIEL